MPLDVEVQEQPPQPPSLLLRLPPHIRHRIFLSLGVSRLDRHPYTYYLDGRKESRTERSEFDPPPGRAFAGLLLSCRTLYAETAALLYSANRFVIRYSYHDSLKPLRVLSPAALASLTSLKIVLNESSCHQPTDSHNYPPSCCYDERKRADGGSDCTDKMHSDVHHRPLLDATLDLDPISAKLATQPILSEWHDVAVYLSSCVAIGRLELSLVCDINPEHEYALDVGQLAVAAIALFPRLKRCHIRLGQKPNRPLQQLAEEAALQACRASPDSHPRPATISSVLTNLPPELRHRILEYTDLITPWKEVTLSRQHAGYQVCRPPCRDAEGGCPPHIHHGCRLIQCSSDVDSLGVSEFQRPGCFCRRCHAAFTPTCACWAPPTSLFLICRVLCRDAQFVFFSGNRFVVHDFRALMPWALAPDPQSLLGPPPGTTTGMGYPYERLLASRFLREIIPPNCLANLRFVELVFPPYAPHVWPRNRPAATMDWRDTIEWIRGRLCAPALTLSVVMVDFHGEGDSSRRNLTQEQGNQIIKGYADILGVLRPLARDDGLAGFCVQAAYPWRWTPGAIVSLQRDPDLLVEAERQVKKNAEDFVWGEDRDPGKKVAPRKSVWQRWYEVNASYSYLHW